MKNFDEILGEMICLECGQKTKFFRIDKRTGINVCERCHHIYILERGIVTALPKKYLDKGRYLDFFSKNKLFFKKNYELCSRFKKLIEGLPKKKKTWEDDDVVFWDDKYVKDCLELQTKKLVARTYLRDKILFKPTRDLGLKNHYILEIGCGEAISAQKSLLPFGNNFVYFATDYSHRGLELLQKRLKSKKNIIYLQCLGDAIPFKDNTFNEIISLGVLHHMPKKEAHIPYLAKKLVPGGLMLVNEAYEREYRLPRIIERAIQIIIEPRQSAHEERISIKRLRNNFKKDGKILKEFHTHTPVKTVLIRITGSLYERSVGFVRFVLVADILTQKTLGKIWGLFSTGDCLLLFQKSKEN